MNDRSRDEITDLLNRYDPRAQDHEVLERLISVAYRELRSLAGNLMRRERINHTLQPTALANEAYLRIFDTSRVSFEGRTHFFGIAAHAMRQILIQHARNRNAAKRGGAWRRVTLSDVGDESCEDAVDILDLHEALERYTEMDERGGRVVELRVFAGLTMKEIAVILGVTRRTIQKDWRVATMWLRREFSRGEEL